MRDCLKVALVSDQAESERGLKPVLAPFIREAIYSYEVGASGKCDRFVVVVVVGITLLFISPGLSLWSASP